jgi:N6-adenosine-specific RNA methylase IME4
MQTTMRIDSIQIGPRARKDMGDIDSLARSIADVGLLHPVVVTPSGLLIAGQRRLEACKRLGFVDVAVTVIDLDNPRTGERAENIERKDFTPSESVAIWEACENNAGVRTDLRPNRTEVPPEPRQQAASLTGYGHNKLSRARAVVQSGYTDLVETMDERGKVDWAYREMVKRKAPPTPALPTGKYRVIYADPPWEYGNSMPEYFPEQGEHYATMTIPEICALDVKSLAEDNAILFLWVTSPILAEAFDVVHAWGFVYKASFVWDKVKHVMGHYNSVRHEFLLVCVRGNCQPDVHQLFDSVVTEERTEHSRKPEIFRKIIDTIYTTGKRIELFARERHDGWDVYGNEIIS